MCSSWKRMTVAQSRSCVWSVRRDRSRSEPPYAECFASEELVELPGQFRGADVGEILRDPARQPFVFPRLA